MANIPAAAHPDRQALDGLRQLRVPVAWPTILLCSAVLCAYGITTYAAFTGQIPASLAVVINALLVYLAYTPLHEACHGNIFEQPSPRNQILTRVIGVFASAPMMHNFSLHQTTHLSHHRHLNDPHHDADHWVNGGNALSIFLRLSTVVVSHYAAGLRINRDTKAGRLAIRRGLSENAIWVAIMIGLSLAGYGQEVLLFIFLPAILGQIILAFTFDWIVHYPYDGDNRFRTTNAFLPKNPAMARLAYILTCGQNLHLMHHLYPWVPFYRYAAAMRRTEPHLKDNAARIIAI
jgi:beta-carotene hydroxylase